MTQRDKLLAKIKAHPNSVRFHDMHTLLGYFGYRLVRVTGSHYRYRREGTTPITLTRHGAQVSPKAVTDILDMLKALMDGEQEP